MGGGGQHQWGTARTISGGGRGQFGGQGGQADTVGGWDATRRRARIRRRRAPSAHGGKSPRAPYLGLTDEQVGRLHKIGVEAEKASVQTRADMELRHIELRELMRAENPDHDAIMQKLDEVNALRGKMEKQQVETMLSARGVLTPEQRRRSRPSWRIAAPAAEWNVDT